MAKDASILELITSEEVAQAGLQELSAGENTQGVGPLILESETIDSVMTSRMAAAYIRGFSAGEQVYPYYRSKV